MTPDFVTIGSNIIPKPAVAWIERIPSCPLIRFHFVQTSTPPKSKSKSKSKSTQVQPLHAPCWTMDTLAC